MSKTATPWSRASMLTGYGPSEYMPTGVQLTRRSCILSDTELGLLYVCPNSLASAVPVSSFLAATVTLQLCSSRYCMHALAAPPEPMTATRLSVTSIPALSRATPMPMTSVLYPVRTPPSLTTVLTAPILSATVSMRSRWSMISLL